MFIEKQKRRIKQVENHLRLTARQLLKFDTEEEAVLYLTDSFQTELGCDFVGVILIEEDMIQPKVWSGDLVSLKSKFPVNIEDCSPILFQKSLKTEDAVTKDCQFIHLLEEENVETWFTVPLKDDQVNYGFCVIAYLEQTPLFEIRETFDEFGKDVAIALSLAKRKEKERQRLMDMEWISQNLYLGNSIDKLVALITKQAGKVTNADFAGIYLYDEKQDFFKFQPPSYGNIVNPEMILIEGNYELKKYFPYLETVGANQLTVPLMIDLQTVGVLHVENTKDAKFTESDFETLSMQANYFAAMLENVRLYQEEKYTKSRLKSLLTDHQALVKETIEQDHFTGITRKLSEMFRADVILFDGFMHLISRHSQVDISSDTETIRIFVAKVVKERKGNNWSATVKLPDTNRTLNVWQVNGGGELLGFLVVDITEIEMDAVNQLTIDLVRNIFSIQFIKEKLVLDTKEQVKESFIHQLLVEDLQERESILQYANLFQWDIYRKHRVAVLSINQGSSEVKNADFFTRQSKKLVIRDLLKIKLSMFEKDVLVALNDENYILIVPAEDNLKEDKRYWDYLEKKFKIWLQEAGMEGQVTIGIGGIADSMENYYPSYQQAMQAMNVVTNHDDKSGYKFFEELGSYVLLHDLKESQAASLFMKKHLEKMINYSKGNNMDLFQTLRVFLEQNGSIKKTAENLFIHRSTLLYRLEKIKELMDINLDNSETRFNLMMAYKLYDLEDTNPLR